MLLSQSINISDNYLPVKLMKVMANDMPGMKSEPGLILTKADYFAIKNYVRVAAKLPYENPIRRQGMFACVPDELFSLPIAIRSHASKWRNIEEKIFNIARDLRTYFQKMNQVGNTISVEVEQLLSQYYQDPGNTLIDQKTSTLANYLYTLLQALSTHISNTNILKQIISVFYDDISLLVPEAQKPDSIFNMKYMFASDISYIDLGMDNIVTCLQRAEVGVNNLEFVWESASQSLGEAYKHLNAVQNLENVLLFKVFFERILSSWEHVESYAIQLENLLISARQEWIRHNR